MISITCNCVEISAFNEGVAAILTSDGVGFINTKGELIIPTIFEQVSHTKRINTRLYVQRRALRVCERWKMWLY